MRKTPALAIALMAVSGAGLAQERAIVGARPASGPTPDLALIAREWADAELIPVAALGQDRPQGPRVTYYSGALPNGDSTRPDGVPLLSAYLNAHPGLAVLLLNTCASDTQVGGNDFADWDRAGEWLVAYPLQGGGDCDPLEFAQTVLAAMEGPPQGWGAAWQAAGLGVASGTGLTPPSAPNPPPALQPVANDVIIISTAHSIRRAPRIVARDVVAQDVAARSAGPSLAQSAALVGGVQDRSVQPLRPGMPQPSIIVGEQAIPRPEVQSGPLGVDAGRRAEIRRDSAGIYAEMLAEGGFDPAPDQVAAALQTELARMGCYGSAVDGLWGAGSVSAVQRYFAKAGGQAATTQAELALYRQIIGQDDVRCDPLPAPTPTAVTTPSAPRAGGSGGTSRPAATGSSAPRAPAATQSPPAASQPSRPTISPGFGGTGLFR